MWSEIFDLDFVMCIGVGLLVCLLYCVFFGENGLYGDSCILVLNCLFGEDVFEVLCVVEVCFVCFFNNMLIVIVLLDKEGCVLCINVLFFRLFGVVDMDD